MSRYIVVQNIPNRIATVHLSSCSHLGPSPFKSTPSARRSAFGDGLEAVLAARAAMPNKFGLCGHCLRHLKALRIEAVPRGPTK
jgi:hypothetical protein